MLICEMASVPAALRDLGSPQGRLAAFRHVTDGVFGPCAAGQAAHWRPRPYEDNKSRCGAGFGGARLASLCARCRCQRGRDGAQRGSLNLVSRLLAGTCGLMHLACATTSLLRLRLGSGNTWSKQMH
jgi:hypothetical protein